MTDPGCTFKHELGRNYDEVELSIVAKDGNVIILRLDKDLDGSDKLMDDIESFHYIMELVCDGINRGFITVNGEDV